MGKIVVFLLCTAFFSTATSAAPVYLRFEGQIDIFYNELGGNLFDWGFTPGQQVYFDYVVDIEQPSSDGNPSHYYAQYLGGSLPVTATFDSAAYDSYAVEGQMSFLDSYLASTLIISRDLAWYSSQDYVDFLLIDWQVGDWFHLMHDWYADKVYGDLVLTYKGSVAPPPMIPIPAAVWLFLSGLGVLAGTGLRKNRHRLA